MGANPHIVVMGVTGAGKSTVGAALAAELDVPFGEGDAFHSTVAIAKMEAGEPLTDVDREPWLEELGTWLASQVGGAVLTCSALKRSYRDRLRAGAPDTFFVHLHGSRATVLERVAARPGHFMPASLVASQFADLEPLVSDELGVTLDFEHQVGVLLTEVRAALAATLVAQEGDR